MPDTRKPRRTKVGRVTSNKMDKTVVVAVELDGNAAEPQNVTSATRIRSGAGLSFLCCSACTLGCVDLGPNRCSCNEPDLLTGCSIQFLHSRVLLPRRITGSLFPRNEF